MEPTIVNNSTLFVDKFFYKFVGILKNGDQIDINVPARQIGGRLTQTEMQIRYARWQAPDVSGARGFLARYSRSVSEVNEAAILK